MSPSAANKGPLRWVPPQRCWQQLPATPAFAHFADAVAGIGAHVGAAGFPTVADLNGLLPAPVSFVASAGPMSALAYEHRIVGRGEVSCRPDNWHDLLNALCWWRWPQLKSAFSRCHVGSEENGGATGSRGGSRDAATLLDESGLVVASANPALEDALRRRDWHTLFVTCREALIRDWVCIPCGHALLEKCLQPFRSITAKCLIVPWPEVAALRRGDAAALPALDQAAVQVFHGLLRQVTAGGAPDLPPLPVAGLPGWWPGNEDVEFYRDQTIFRPPRQVAGSAGRGGGAADAPGAGE